VKIKCPTKGFDVFDTDELISDLKSYGFKEDGKLLRITRALVEFYKLHSINAEAYEEHAIHHDN
jgi:hypothetical protein